MFKANNHSDLVGFEETSKRTYSFKKSFKKNLWIQTKWSFFLKRMVLQKKLKCRVSFMIEGLYRKFSTIHHLFVCFKN